MNPKKSILFIVAPTLIIGCIIMIAYSTDSSAGKPFGVFNDFAVYLLDNISMIPPQLSFMALVIFGLMAAGMVTVLNYRGKLTATKRRRDVAHSIALRIKEMDKSLKIMDFAMEEVIMEILKKHKLP